MLHQADYHCICVDSGQSTPAFLRRKPAEQEVSCYRMKYLLVISCLLSIRSSAQQLNSLVADLKALQAQALEIPLPSLPQSEDTAHPPTLHPLLPSRPIHPPSLHSQVPAEICNPNCSILDLLVFNPDFSTLVSILKIGDLIDVLSTATPITIFAPTNAAFDGLPTPLFRVIYQSLRYLFLSIPFQSLLSNPDQLQATLLRHLSKGRILSDSFPEGSTPLVTGAGEQVTITTFPDQITISSELAVGNIIEIDNVASNGVVHVLDIVL